VGIFAQYHLFKISICAMISEQLADIAVGVGLLGVTYGSFDVTSNQTDKISQSVHAKHRVSCIGDTDKT
jgi:hypothetical protein